MSAARLREAAKVLRDRAEAATPGPWRVGLAGDIDGGKYDTVIGRGPVDCMGYCYGGSSTIEGDRLDEDRAYIATMSPPVALALADWLDEFANLNLRWTDRPGAGPVDPNAACLAVADAILGDRA